MGKEKREDRNKDDHFQNEAIASGNYQLLLILNATFQKAEN